MQAYTWNEKSDIALSGKYTTVQGIDSKGSMFYKDMLYNEKEVRDPYRLQNFKRNDNIYVRNKCICAGISIGKRECMWIFMYRYRKKKDGPITGEAAHEKTIVTCPQSR